MNVAVAIPTLNEQESIGDVVRSIPRDVVDQIIVADGGSGDRTREEALAGGADVIDAGRGYGRACLMATVNAVDAAIMVFMDGDGADDPASIAALVSPIQSGAYDFVIGSRVRGEREPGSIAWHQIGAGLAAVAELQPLAEEALREDPALELAPLGPPVLEGRIVRVRQVHAGRYEVAVEGDADAEEHLAHLYGPFG